MLTGKAALLINECQFGVIDERYSRFKGLAEQVEQRQIVPRIADLAAAFRAAGLPVIHAPVAHRPDLADIKPNSLINALTLKQRSMIEGSIEADYVPQLTPQDGDFEIVRPAGLIAIAATALDALLRRMDITTLVLTGVSTNIAIPGNAILASELGYHVVIAEDCIAGSDAASHAVLLENQLRMVARISTAADIVRALPARI